MNNDVLEEALKTILTVILDRQSDLPSDDDMMGMMGMGEHGEMDEGKGPLHVEVSGEDEEDLEDGLEEAMKYIESMPLDELLGKDEGHMEDEDHEEMEHSPEDEEDDEEMMKALRKPRGGKY